jgi:hypothetical protein
MWQRRTFHDCAVEMRQTSDAFRAAYLNTSGWSQTRRDELLRSSSRRGVEVLRTLALAVRSEQDYGLTTDLSLPVGALRAEASPDEVLATIRDYRPPYDCLARFRPLGLREALNKIAHADPARAGFFADEDHHDLVLSGSNRGQHWVAVVSVLKLCDAIESIPDLSLPRGVT